MKHIVPIIVVVAIFIALFALPVSAAVAPPAGIDVFGYDFSDLFGNFTGSTNWLVGKLRKENVNPYYNVYKNSSRLTGHYGWEGPVGTWTEPNLYTINFWPLGLDPNSSAGNSNLIDLTSLPEGCEFYFDFRVNIGAPVGTPDIRIDFIYYDFQRGYLTRDYHIVTSTELNEYYYTPREVTNAIYMGIQITLKDFDPFDDYSTQYYLSFNWFDFDIYFVPDGNTAVLHDILNSQIENKYLIEEILGKLDNLDDLQGVLDPVTPPGGDIPEYDSSVDGIVNGTDGGISDAQTEYETVVDALNSFISGFNAVKIIFSCITYTPDEANPNGTGTWYFLLLLQLSMSLGLFGFMTGLIGAGISKFSVRSKGGGKD